jgi:hypothetical protein
MHPLLALSSALPQEYFQPGHSHQAFASIVAASRDDEYDYGNDEAGYYDEQQLDDSSNRRYGPAPPQVILCAMSVRVEAA